MPVEDLIPLLPKHAIAELQRLCNLGLTPPGGPKLDAAPVVCEHCKQPAPLFTSAEQKWLLYIYRAVLRDAALANRVRAAVEVEKKQLLKKRQDFDKQKRRHAEELTRGEVVPRSLHEELIKEELEVQKKMDAEIQRLSIALHELTMDKTSVAATTEHEHGGSPST